MKHPKPLKQTASGASDDNPDRPAPTAADRGKPDGTAGQPESTVNAVDGAPLDDFFPYLVNLITNIIAVHFQKMGRPLGITIERWRVLYFLMRRGPMRASGLSALTGIEASTMSHLLTRMVRAGLITREKDIGDARAMRIDLSREGRALVERVLPLALQYETVALSGMSTEEKRQFKETLRKIARNLNALDEKIVTPNPERPDPEA